MKTIQSLIAEAAQKRFMWRDIAADPSALADRGKTREEALCLENYFEGKGDGLVDSLSLKD